MDSKRKSNLNPNAAPFVPSSKSSTFRPPHTQNPNPTLVEDKRHQHAPQETREKADMATEYKLPDSISFDYEVGMTDEQRVVENISNMYPEIPKDFIAEFAGAHGYDFDLTIDMLEQFYVPQAESSDSHGDVGLHPHKAGPGTGSSS